MCIFCTFNTLSYNNSYYTLGYNQGYSEAEEIYKYPDISSTSGTGSSVYMVVPEGYTKAYGSGSYAGFKVNSTWLWTNNGKHFSDYGGYYPVKEGDELELVANTYGTCTLILKH